MIGSRLRFGESEYRVEPRFLRGMPCGASRTAWPLSASETPTDVFFLGAASDTRLHVLTALSLPCALARDGRLMPDPKAAGRAHDWRIGIDSQWPVPMETPLSGDSLVAGGPRPGEYDAWDSPAVPLERACSIFLRSVPGIDFGGAQSVMSVATTSRIRIKYSRSIGWYTTRGMLQRMRTKCYKSRRNGIFCLPTGHPDCVEMFSAARTKLNVGSSRGGWPKSGGGRSSVTSRPLNMFYSDAVQIDIEDYIILQAANLLAHSVLFKIQNELGWLPGHLRGFGVETAYDRLAPSVLNTAATGSRRDAIVLNDDRPEHGIYAPRPRSSPGMTSPDR